MTLLCDQCFTSLTSLIPDEAMRCSRIKQNNNSLIMDKEGTRHHWRTIGELSQAGVVEPSLANLHLGPSSPIGRGVLASLLMLVPGAVFGKMPFISAGETAVAIHKVRRR